MENLLGLLRINIKRGVDLAVRDVQSSDPYVVVSLGKQKLRTRAVKKCLNPEWNEDLTLCITDPNQPVELKVGVLHYTESLVSISRARVSSATANFVSRDKDMVVYDKDTLSVDDKMGDAEFDIKPYVEALKMELRGIPSGTIITRVKPCRQNCLAEESNVVWSDGEVVQTMFLRLRDVERGEVEVELRWTRVPGSEGPSKA